jgi:methylated-DNA-[protein]-cysteine S-methyltransferase
LELDLRATPFQLSVYQILDEIPYGEAISYAEVARRLGRPSAVRAVGSANGSNPMPLIVPCHRVVAADGQLHGYAGGVDLKARLLAMESATRPAAGQLF